MWIRGGRKCQPANEREHVMAGHMCVPVCRPAVRARARCPMLRCRYFVAVHSGFKEMREGITFIIDSTDDNMTQRVGNEQKLQKTYVPQALPAVLLCNNLNSYQAFPLRPQALFIAGAGFVKRTSVSRLARASARARARSRCAAV